MVTSKIQKLGIIKREMHLQFTSFKNQPTLLIHSRNAGLMKIKDSKKDLKINLLILKVLTQLSLSSEVLKKPLETALEHAMYQFGVSQEKFQRAQLKKSVYKTSLSHLIVYLDQQLSALSLS